MWWIFQLLHPNELTHTSSGFICLCVMPGDTDLGLVPPSSRLVYIAKDEINKKALEHIEQLNTAKVVWMVKTSDTKEVTPCGLAVVIAKQIVCNSGVNVLS